MELGAEVVLAADGRSKILLEQEFPELQMLQLDGYRPVYPTGNMMVIKMALQSPRLLKRVYCEHKELKAIIKSEKIDLVISDNRFGLSTRLVPCVIINHQLNIQMPGWFKFMQPAVNWMNRYFVRQFSECWIPDSPGENSLTGKLTEGFEGREGFHFIGPLSRLTEPENTGRFDHEVLVLLSGAEPQRTVFEEKVISQLKNSDKKVLVVQGITETRTSVCISEKLCLESYLTSTEVAQAITQAEVVIARSGYSTVMDLAKLRKKAILIPTPGQTEQEYLGERLAEQGVAVVQGQDKLHLSQSIQEIEPLNATFAQHPETFDRVIERFVVG